MALLSRARPHDLDTEPDGLHGAVARVEDLIALRGAARHFTWVARNRVRSARAGVRASRFRGRGIDFSEVRVYEPGDDVRHIDWRVTARTGTAHTKIYQEERERPILVVADLGPSSFFGTRRRMKSLAVAELAALLVWAAFDAGDRIGALVRDADSDQAFRPRHSRATVLRILAELAGATERLATARGAAGVRGRTAPALTLADALMQARRVARPGTTVIVVSDFADGDALAADGDVRRHLRLLSRHCEVDAILVSDPFERELPRADVYPISDGETRTVLDTGPEATRAAWRARHAERVLALEEIVHTGRGRLLEVGTEEDLDRRLQGWLR